MYQLRLQGMLGKQDTGQNSPEMISDLAAMQIKYNCPMFLPDMNSFQMSNRIKGTDV